MLTISSLVTLIVYILIAGIIFGLLWWLIDYVKLPEPFAKVARVVLAVFAVLILIGMLLAFVGHPVVKFE